VVQVAQVLSNVGAGGLLSGVMSSADKAFKPTSQMTVTAGSGAGLAPSPPLPPLRVPIWV
jgi:hypothetical protein